MMIKKIQSYKILAAAALSIVLLLLNMCGKSPDGSGEKVQTASEIFNKVMESSGGEKLLMSVGSQTVKGKMIIYAKSGEEEFPMEMIFSYPDKAFVKLAAGSSEIISVLNGNKGRLIALGMDTDLPDAEIKEMKYRLIRNIAWLTQNLEKGSLNNTDERSDQENEFIELRFLFEETELKMVVNSKTWLPESYILNEGNDVYAMKMLNYRKVDGINLPFQYDLLYNQRITTRIIIDEILINSELKDNIFDLK
ncbi:hypothetical protein ACFL6G_00080 [candidate division KSB1 bacterium]